MTSVSLFFSPKNHIFVIEIKEYAMTNGVYVNIPKNDMPFFRKLSRKMGWAYSTQEEKEETLKSIEQSFKELKSAQTKGETLPDVEELFAALQTV
ncbi:MAG: hypothetical protein IJQ61_02095 [Bacteroidales bacterium]|nr:hypothetical protein [Bacteroidales bacterium]